MRFIVVSVCLISSAAHSFGQRNLGDSSIHTLLTSVHYKLNVTSGEIRQLWGLHHELGISVDHKFPTNLTVGGTGGFLFGNQFRDTSIFKTVVNDFGTVTALDGSPAELLFLMRGMTAHLNLGYVWNRWGNNLNSGIWLQLSAGFLMHKIRIESTWDEVPQLQGDYRKGYDRLHSGFQLRQFVGYLFQADKRFLNFYAGVECIQAWTRNRRNYNFDLQGPDPGVKNDYLWGVKVGWLIPIYKRTPRAFYFD